MIVWLIGMMGSGKTVTGTAAARLVDVPFVDTDVLVAATYGAGIPEIWEKAGEAGFRRLEREAIGRVAAGHRGFAAAGGGAVLDAANVAAMRGSGTVAWLRAGAAELAARLSDVGDSRPLLRAEDPQERLRTLLEQRRAAYEEAADVEIDTSGRAAAEVAEEVAALWTG